MRTLIYNTLHTMLAETEVGDRIYQRGAVGVGSIPANPEKPFIIIGEGATDPFQAVSETSDAENIPYQVWVYDDRGSYVRLSKIIRKFEPAIKSLAGLRSTTGALCLGVAWGGVSQDFVDPEYDANVRFASFTVTATHHEEA